MDDNGNNLNEKLFDEYNKKLENKYDNFYEILESFFVCLCRECIPIINEIAINNIRITTICNMLDGEQYPIEYVSNNFIQQINTYNKNFDECKIHYKKFEYYCTLCKKHLCKYCSQESNEHAEHDIIIFDYEIEDTEEMASNIKAKIDIRNDINPNIKELFNVIYSNFFKNKKYYSYIKIFDAFNIFLNHQKN